MISIIIPAHNEQRYLNKTIESILSTAEGQVEVIVVLNGYDQQVDSRAIVLKNTENLGMRKAWNRAAKIAAGQYLFFIDAHCRIEPKGWDTKMLEVLRQYPRGIAVTPITAMNRDFTGKRGWYGFCEMRPNMQPVWKGKETYGLIEPNPAVTGCGLLMAKDFYRSWGLDENLPKMGAIGSEVSIHGWLDGDGIYTRTDVLLGHVFNTGGYDTAGANTAQDILHERYGHRYADLCAYFSRGKEALAMEPESSIKHRTVIVDRTDEHVIRDDKTGKPIKKVIERFKYVYEDDGNGPSEAEIAKLYGPKARKIDEEIYYPREDGQWVKVA